MTAPTARQAVAVLLDRRSRYVAQRASLEIIPGREPLIGIATADEIARWKALSRRIDWLDEQIASIREAVAA